VETRGNLFLYFHVVYFYMSMAHFFVRLWSGFLPAGLVLLLLLQVVSAEEPDIPEAVISKVRVVVCGFYYAFREIVTGVAAVVMVLAGVKWISSENDPGARKAAKDAMIHALIGLILVSLIEELVKLSASVKDTDLLCQYPPPKAN
jgi:hypothetical protein